MARWGPREVCGRAQDAARVENTASEPGRDAREQRDERSRNWHRGTRRRKTTGPTGNGSRAVDRASPDDFGDRSARGIGQCGAYERGEGGRQVEQRWLAVQASGGQGGPGSDEPSARPVLPASSVVVRRLDGTDAR